MTLLTRIKARDLREGYTIIRHDGREQVVTGNPTPIAPGFIRVPTDLIVLMPLPEDYEVTVLATDF